MITLPSNLEYQSGLPTKVMLKINMSSNLVILLVLLAGALCWWWNEKNHTPPPKPQAPPPPKPQAPLPQPHQRGHSTHLQGPPYVVQTPTPHTGGRPLLTVGCMVSCDRMQALMLPDCGIRSGTKTSAIWTVKACRSDQYWRLQLM